MTWSFRSKSSYHSLVFIDFLKYRPAIEKEIINTTIMLAFTNIIDIMTQRKKTDERRKEITLTAVNIIDAEGIHALTLQRIARDIGISDVALLRHFHSKEEIVEAIAQKVFFDSTTTDEGIASNNVLETLASLLGRQFKMFDSLPQSTAILFQEDIFREYPKIKDWFIQRRQARHDQISMLVKEGQRLGQIGTSVDPDDFALIFMGAMRMAVMEWRDSGYAWKLHDRAESLQIMLLKMLR
jgi:TetR/AcrR family transcriptional regulator, fatty acid metabolism regulator protein